MTPADFERLTPLLTSAGAVLALIVAAALVFERAAFGWHRLRSRRLEHRYAPLVRRALGGDQAALDALVVSPQRHRLAVATLLIVPLVQDRDPARIAATRRVVRALTLKPVAERLLRSRWWWRRALALRVFGLLQLADRSAEIVAALDDAHAAVRAAALDALTDLRDPRSLQGLVIRLNDPSLQRGRRAAAVRAFGSQCEPFLLEVAAADPAHRVHYARALALCGTARSRASLCDWTTDRRADVRADAFAALACVGLDERSARRALDALERGDETERAMAARALRGWDDGGNAASRLARHLDDAWPVALESARALQSVPAGRLELRARAIRRDLGGMLARQMLWEGDAR
jgi:HEAT repeat protein